MQYWNSSFMAILDTTDLTGHSPLNSLEMTITRRRLLDSINFSIPMSIPKNKKVQFSFPGSYQ